MFKVRVQNGTVPGLRFPGVTWPVCVRVHAQCLHFMLQEQLARRAACSGVSPPREAASSSQLHALAVRSQTRMLPFWSPDINSFCRKQENKILGLLKWPKKQGRGTHATWGGVGPKEACAGSQALRREEEGGRRGQPKREQCGYVQSNRAAVQQCNSATV